MQVFNEKRMFEKTHLLQKAFSNAVFSTLGSEIIENPEDKICVIQALNFMSETLFLSEMKMLNKFKEDIRCAPQSPT